MNLDEVNAILIWNDGEPHSFGDKKMVLPDKMTDSNYHNYSFKNEIYSTSWFQDIGFPYAIDKNFTSQLEDMAGYGFTVLCNSSSRMREEGDYYCYLIYVPENMTDNVRDYLESIYNSLKRMIDEHEAFFQAVVVDEEGKYSSPYMFYLDDFYDYLGLKKSIVVNK